MKNLIEIKVNKMYAQPQYIVSYRSNKYLYPEEEVRGVTMQPGIPTRDEVISTIIMDMYPFDKMQAVQNNYLLNPNDEEAVAETNAMQEWRAYAKEIADEFMEYLNENNNN